MMERLTRKDKYGHWYTNSKINDRAESYDYKEINHICNDGIAIDKLAEYEDAEEQGLLVRLPCKIGAELFSIENGYVQAFKTKSLSHIAMLIAFNRINDTVFFTRAEAEQALSEVDT